MLNNTRIVQKPQNVLVEKIYIVQVKVKVFTLSDFGWTIVIASTDIDT
jgi:hypothetical protein